MGVVLSVILATGPAPTSFRRTGQYTATGVNDAREVVRPAVPQTTEGKREVSEGNVFLVSDNRAFAFDSRTYGAIPRASCKESVFFRVYGAKGLGDSASRFVYIR